jgi:ribosome-binding factor A
VEGVTLTGIRLSNDLKEARIYFSVLGDETRIKRVQGGLESAKGFIKREIGVRLSLRYIPGITFVYDPSLERASHMERVFEKLKTDESKDALE